MVAFSNQTEYTDILHCYGPHVPSSNILVEHSSDADIDDDYDRQYEEISPDFTREYNSLKDLQVHHDHI